MVRSGSKRSLRLASICSDEVMKGGWGRWVRGVEAIEATVTFACVSCSAMEFADSSLKTSTGALASRRP